MRTRRYIYILGGTTVMFLTGYVWVRATDTTAKATPRRAQGEAPVLGAEHVTQLEERLRSLEASERVRAVRQAIAPVPSAPPAEELRPVAAPTHEQLQERTERETKAQIDLMESQIRAEPVDPAWASKAATNLLDTYSRKNFMGARVEDAKCFSTLCRVSLQATTMEALQKGGTVAMNQVPWDAEFFYYTSESDPTKMTLFVAREGFPIQRARVEESL